MLISQTIATINISRKLSLKQKNQKTLYFMEKNIAGSKKFALSVKDQH